MESRARILIVDDEPLVRKGLEENLLAEGYDVVCAENGKQGIERVEQENFDLLILDLMMPGVDGLEVCKQVRRHDEVLPILMLSARGNEFDRVVGLELGADDFLTKPFAMRELFARVKAILRRVRVHTSAGSLISNASNLSEGNLSEENIAEGNISAAKENNSPATNYQITANNELNPAAAVLVFGDVQLDFRTMRAKKGQHPISLSAKEFELLRFLASKRDEPVTRDQLLDHVWGYNSYPSTRTVDNFIARLRQKLEDLPERPRFILTIHGIGYKLAV